MYRIAVVSHEDIDHEILKRTGTEKVNARIKQDTRTLSQCVALRALRLR